MRTGQSELMQAIAAASVPPFADSAHDGSVVVRCFADIEPETIKWLWHPRFPIGSITMLAGHPGCGKSLFTCDCAARISTGRPWPDGKPCPKGDVLFITSEDGAADTIRPRLDAAGADVKRVHIVDGVRKLVKGKERIDLIDLADITAIENALNQFTQCRLVVVDPIGSFIGAKTDAYRDNEVRAILAPLAQLANTRKVAVLCVAHTTKGAATRADDAILGSRAFSGIARSVLHLGFDRDGDAKERRLLVPGKTNLAARSEGLAFRAVSVPGTELPRIEWEPDPVDMDADDAFAGIPGQKRGPEPEAQKEAERFLNEALAMGPRPSTDILAEARDRYGISKRSLDRARSNLRIKTKQSDGPGSPWMLSLPDVKWSHPVSDTPDDSKDATFGE